MIENNLAQFQATKEEISLKMKENYKSDFLKGIKSCGEGKKLRTYTLFKNVIKSEPYSNFVKNSRHIIRLSKFGLSADGLEIERGRYGKKLKPEERYCKLCQKYDNLTTSTMAEDKLHF